VFILGVRVCHRDIRLTRSPGNILLQFSAIPSPSTRKLQVGPGSEALLRLARVRGLGQFKIIMTRMFLRPGSADSESDRRSGWK
jgi:hypothetical protein